jgi:pSer/pThr/pTyr-binding forkhead associated (FHA) protein
MSAPNCKLIVTRPDGSELTLLLDEECTIGRSECCNLVLRHKSVSRIHATLVLDTSGRHVLHDGSLFPTRPSANGVFVNGSRRKAALLNHGDLISIADVQMVYLCNQDTTDESKQTYSGSHVNEST